MDLLILMTYAAIAIAVFRIFKLPVNGFTIATVALGGVAILSLLLILMNYNHPYSHVARFYFHTTPVVPDVRGRVIEVAVGEAQQVEAGEVLFKIDPTPYQAAVDQAQARLAAAKQIAGELKVSLAAAEEAYHAALARRDAARDTYERDKDLVGSAAITEARMVQERQNYLGAEADASRAKAEVERSRLEAESSVNGVHTDVAEAQAALAAAEFNLQQTVVRAPTNGAVLQVMLRPGMMAVPLPLKPVMVFQHDEDRFFVASFLQNSAQRIDEGAEVEAIFPAVPGRVFKGRVSLVGAVVAQGQLQPSGDLIVPDKIQGAGRINVMVEFNEGEFDGFQIPPGSSAQVAVDSDHVPQVAIMRRVLMRVKSWTNYLFTDGHDLP